MGMWEEASDPVMGKKDKNEERKERILNLTLEIIYLLTGESYIPKKSPTLGLGALHAPGSVIQKENDKKILELISNIIQLLTGEVAIRCEDISIYFSLEEWEYIKGNKALLKEAIKEKEPQQLHPLDGEYEDKREIPADLGGTLCYNNEPSKIGAEGADFCANRNLTNPEMSPAEQPPPANGIKEEAASCERKKQPNCSLYPCTEQIQGTDTPTPIMGCSLNNSSAANYVLDDIKEEAALCEEGNRVFSKSKQKSNKYVPFMSCSLNYSLSDRSDGIKEEATSWEGGNQSDCSINPLTEQIQGTDTPTPSSERRKQFRSKGGQKTDKEVKPFVCSVCEKCFAWYSDLLVHRKIHTVEKPFSCSECGKCFARRVHLIEHQRTHTGEKPYSCSDCGKRFSYRSDFNRHCKRHKGHQIFTCSQCNKPFTSHSDLVVHRRIHSENRLFSCSECGKNFKHRSHFTVHKRIHTGEKPFTCPKCDKRFAHRSNLIKHLRHHKAEETFPCSQCGEHFPCVSELNVHFKVHTGERPYSCSECGKSFKGDKQDS
eukprot:XP_012817507.1 PREDICTED: gastrula zinc finger protein XlCGF53.1-like [Xenopus tropicalis]